MYNNFSHDVTKCFQFSRKTIYPDKIFDWWQEQGSKLNLNQFLHDTLSSPVLYSPNGCMKSSYLRF